MKHTWRFSRIGGVNRVNLHSGEDLRHLDELDQKLWTALSCPVEGLELDVTTLRLIDGDGDGRIKVNNVRDAVRWIVGFVKDADELLERRQSLPLDSINQDNPQGKTLYASAKQLLRYLGKGEQTELKIAETSDTNAIFANSAFNGDGIITEASTKDETLRACIANIIACIGGADDRSGAKGINADLLAQFTTEAEAYTAWQADKEARKSEIYAFGEDTPAFWATYCELKPKVEDFFLRCRLMGYDPDSAQALADLTSRIVGLASQELSTAMAAMASLPLAKINPEGKFPLNPMQLNPAWSDKLLQLSPQLGNSQHCSAAEWKAFGDKIAAYGAWLSAKAGAAVESLGTEALAAYLKSDQQAQLQRLIGEDLALATECDNILLVDKLTRYYCHIGTLLRNFVNFSDFYNPQYPAIFQAGVLYLDSRACDLCIKVSDMARHNTMAAASGICLVYVDCTSKNRSDKMTIVAALTDGDIDNVVVGRNAIFYDNAGHDWDAVIAKIVDNSISIRQAFWSPYRKMSNLISTQLEKIASAQDAKVNASLTGNIEQVSSKANAALGDAVKPTTPPAAAAVPPAPDPAAAPPAAAAPAAPKPAPTPFDIAKFAGIFAAIGLALAGILEVLKTIFSAFITLPLWQKPMVFLGILLIISGPSMLMAWLKLRKRNLALVLDANGWAINAEAKINITFGASLTHLATLPAGAQLNALDPFADKRNPYVWGGLIAAAVLGVVAAVLWYLGYLHQWGILS